MSRQNPTTSLTLIGRMAADEPDAWRLYKQLYAPLIYGWCRRSWGMNEEDAEEISQEVFIKVRRALLAGKGPETGKFRGWLRTIVKRACIDSQSPIDARGGDTNLQQLANVEAPTDADEAEAKFSEKAVLLRQALSVTQSEFSGRDIRIFLAVADGRDRGDIAHENQMTKNAVYVVTSKVKRRLQEVFKELLDADILPKNDQEHADDE